MSGKRFCPECGCPLSNETVCPECGNRFVSTPPNKPSGPESHYNKQQDASPKQSHDVNTDTPLETLDYRFNEHPEPYSPFKSDSWFFKTPSLLARYPRGRFAIKYPLLGWLFGPWHLDVQSESDKLHYDALNNFFYYCNLWFKLVTYCSLWTFLKLLPMIIILIVLVLILIAVSSAAYSSGDYDSVHFLTGIITVYSIIFYIIGAFVSIFGIGRSLHRYWPEIHRTFYRMWHRFCNSMYSGAKNNSLND